MAILTVQFALAQNTATRLLSKAAGFNNVSGAAMDPIPLIIKNEDASATVWLSGPTVSPTAGQSLGPGASVAMALYSNDVPYAYTTSAALPIVSVMGGRQ